MTPLATLLLSTPLGAASLTALNQMGGPGSSLALRLTVAGLSLAAMLVPALIRSEHEAHRRPAAPPAPRPDARQEPVQPAAAPAADAPRTSSSEVVSMNDVTMAVIAAAVAAVLPQPHQIVSVRPAGDTTWSQEGRRQIFASHQLIRH